MDRIKKAQRRRWLLLQIVAVGFILVAVVALGFVFLQFSSGSWQLFSTQTATATITPTQVIPTSTLYLTPTPTLTETPSLTPTRSGPVEHEIQAGESLFFLVDLYQVTIDNLIAYNLQETGVDLSSGILSIGQIVLIPPEDFEVELPTETPIPENLRPGSLIEYTVRPGDLLGFIAERFNTTMSAIIEENDLENPDNIPVGTVLRIPYNLITLTPVTPTLTSVPTRVATGTPPAPTATP